MSNSHGPVTDKARRDFLKLCLYGGMSACLPAGFFLNGCGPKPGDKKPNIIFILIDTLRADRLGAYGHTGGYTPTLDSIASESVVFDQAIAQSSWTQPSVASLFCSHYPSVHKVLKWSKVKPKDRPAATKVAVLDDSFTTMAEAFRQSGYQTAAFVANAFVIKDLGFAQGFDLFDSTFAHQTTPGSVVNDVALEWLDKRSNDRPFFCYLHYMDVHGPYKAHPDHIEPLLDKVEAMPNKRKLTQKEIKKLGYLYTFPEFHCPDIERHKRLSVYREYWEARYDSGVMEMDMHLKALKEKLQRMGMWDDTYVIITADHGEELLEHGFWDHGFTMHHTELHVPLIMRWPGVLEAGKRVEQTVQLIDLMPTFIEKLGLQKVDGLQGRSLVQHLEGDGPAVAPPAIAEGGKASQQGAVYNGDWKLIRSTKWSRTGNLHLYNRLSDPMEMADIAQAQPEEKKQLAALLHKQSAANRLLKDKIWIERVTLSKEQEERLRSLGYLE